MTTEKSFKRVVRARMEKTGESYTAARAMLLGAVEPKANEGPALAVSEDVIRLRTGRGWEEWFDLLDEWGAAGRPPTEIRRWVAEQHGIDSWGSQAVAITYERARGLRAVGEAPTASPSPPPRRWTCRSTGCTTRSSTSRCASAGCRRASCASAPR